MKGLKDSSIDVIFSNQVTWIRPKWFSEVKQEGGSTLYISLPRRHLAVERYTVSLGALIPRHIWPFSLDVATAISAVELRFPSCPAANKNCSIWHHSQRHTTNSTIMPILCSFPASLLLITQYNTHVQLAILYAN